MTVRFYIISVLFVIILCVDTGAVIQSSANDDHQPSKIGGLLETFITKTVQLLDKKPNYPPDYVPLGGSKNLYDHKTSREDHYGGERYGGNRRDDSSFSEEYSRERYIYPDDIYSREIDTSEPRKPTADSRTDTNQDSLEDDYKRGSNEVGHPDIRKPTRLPVINENDEDSLNSDLGNRMGLDTDESEFFDGTPDKHSKCESNDVSKVTINGLTYNEVTVKKFMFQAQPVVPENERVNKAIKMYYIN